jgi:Fe-S cluster assembly ATP-binding protein
MSPDVRAREGVFMAFQYPVEVPGVSNSQFLRLAYNEKQKHLGEEELIPRIQGPFERESRAG